MQLKLMNSVLKNLIALALVVRPFMVAVKSEGGKMIVDAQLEACLKSVQISLKRIKLA